jgi:glycosyltransferase involved in cell wall biosynthesis
MSGIGDGKGLLFFSYDGVLGGPGRSQVLPYLRAYREDGWSVHLLSYEKPQLLAEEGNRKAVEEELRGWGVRWTVIPRRGRMLRDYFAGSDALARIVDDENPAVLHARSYVPAEIGLRNGLHRGAKLLFDMRGLWPDERLEGGLWSRWNPLYHYWKRLERTLLRSADGVVVLSNAGARLLKDAGLIPPDKPLEVIPCGADLERFRPMPPESAPAELRPFLGKRIWTFLGATGTWYLLDEMLDFAAEAVRGDPESRILFLTEDPQGVIAEGLASRGVPADRFLIRRVPHGDVPMWITPSHAGVFFIRSCRSKRASCPTKLAEFLGCSVPVVVNGGIGDMDETVVVNRVGVVLQGFGQAAFRQAREGLAALRADPAIGTRCRREAECLLDSREGGRRFSRFAARLVSR